MTYLLANYNTATQTDGEDGIKFQGSKSKKKMHIEHIMCIKIDLMISFQHGLWHDGLLYTCKQRDCL